MIEKKRYFLISRVIILVLITLISTKIFMQYSVSQYINGLELTEAKYLLDFNEYKDELLSFEPYAKNWDFSLSVTFLSMTIIIGSYELIVLFVNISLKALFANKKCDR